MGTPFRGDRKVDAVTPRPARGGDAGGPVPSEPDALAAAGRYEEALDAFRSALSRPGLSLTDSLALKRKVAVALESLGRWEDCLATLSEARESAARAGCPSEEAQILIEFGKVHMVRGEIEPALDCADHALQKAVEAADSTTRGYAENLRGYALFRRGNLEESSASFDRALVAFKEAGNLRGLSLVYNNLGLVFKGRCLWKRSLEYFQVAANLNSIEGEETERRKGLHNLGYVHLKLGHWNEARSCFEESLTIARRIGDPLSVIRSLHGLAQVGLFTGDHDRARDLLEQALELCSQDSYPRESAITQRSLGSLHMASGDLDRARRCYEAAWKKAVEVAPEGDLATEMLLLRAELALAVGRAREALSLAQRSQTLARKAGESYVGAEVHRVLGNAARALGNPDQAEIHYKDGITALRGIEAPYPLAMVLLELGRLNAERTGGRGDGPERAVAPLDEAVRLFRDLGISRFRGEALLALARAHVRGGDFDRASAALAEATEIFRNAPVPQSQALISSVQNEIEGRIVEESVSHLNEFRATSRIQEILEERLDVPTRINQIVEVIASTVEADGALLVSSSLADGREPVAFRRMSPAVATALAERLAGMREYVGQRPQIVLNTESCGDLELIELARRRSATSLILIPMLWDEGCQAILYLDRSRTGRAGSFRQGNLNLGVVLSSHLTTLFAQHDLDERINANLMLRRQLEEKIALADVVTQNRDMLQILKLVEKINRSNLTVLLQGETGTGKTLIAKAIHLSSPRGKGPFVTVDCAALPENLLESELFGYMKGSFTGAAQDKKGLFEEADGGTIFLDEIGRAGLTVQRRLLHLLDKGEVRPVGSNSYRQLDVRVICATSSRDLRQDVAQGGFIKDLYYRLNDISIVVPSLRDRVEDIPLLAEYFLATFCAETQREIPGISRAVMNRLVRYNWPGNVRELEKVIRRACILCDDGEPIGIEHLPDELMASGRTEPQPEDAAGGLHETVEEMEKRMVLKALEQCSWNKSHAALALGLSRKGLKNKIARYNLESRGTN